MRRRLREIPRTDGTVKGSAEQPLRCSAVAIAGGGRQQLDVFETVAVPDQGLDDAPRAQVPALDGVLN